jgi:hypothetical protein
LLQGKTQGGQQGSESLLRRLKRLNALTIPERQNFRMRLRSPILQTGFTIPAGRASLRKQKKRGRQAEQQAT